MTETMMERPGPRDGEPAGGPGDARRSGIKRSREIFRKTTETDIRLFLEVDGTGRYDIDTGCGFLNHMLELFARHGRFDLTLTCRGDVEVDDHHTVEDTGIALGSAFREALGEKRGIRRYAHVFLPMDEALALCAVDLSGRGYLVFDAVMPREKVGQFDTELVREFMEAFARNMGITLHFKVFSGENAHHIIEAMFKGMARALREAVSLDPAVGDEIPSTKGAL